MLILETFQLTHPESLSNIELKEILENRCIDFSDYKNLTRYELIELYKRVAMPLPQRESESNQHSDTNINNKETNSVNEPHRNSVSLNGASNTKSSTNEITEIAEPSNTRSATSPRNELNSTPKKLCSFNSNNIAKCNGVYKRNNDEKVDGAPSRKRQKITWP